MTWKKNFSKGKELILATSSKKALPNANVVISLGFVDGKILVANCQMNRTIKNLEENKNICVIGGYVRVKGTVKIFSSGKYFDLANKNNSDFKIVSVILVSIKEVFDLDKVTLVKI